MNTLFDDLREEGEVIGSAKALLVVLTAKGIAVSETDHQRILSCRDIDQLHQWLVRTSRAKSTSELFANH